MADPGARRSENAARTRTCPGARSRSQRRSAVTSPERRLAKAACKTSARYRRSSEKSARPSLAIDHNARSAARCYDEVMRRVMAKLGAVIC